MMRRGDENCSGLFRGLRFRISGTRIDPADSGVREWMGP